MATANTRMSNLYFTRIFLIITMAFLIALGTNATAYASEATVTSETLTDNTDTAAIDPEGTLGVDYYIDEQGQVYYNDPEAETEEPVIVDVPEEDADEDAAEAEETDKDSDKPSKDDKPEVKKPTYSEADLRLLSCLIYAEAGGQSYNGMLAVANVVLNRAKSDVYWHVNTVKEVIYDHKWSVQFSVTIKSKKTGLSPLDKALKYYDSGKFTGSNPEAEKNAMNRAIKAAKAALEGKNNIGNYLCFTNKRAAGGIKRNYPDYKIIGDHIFYRTK